MPWCEQFRRGAGLPFRAHIKMMEIGEIDCMSCEDAYLKLVQALNLDGSDIKPPSDNQKVSVICRAEPSCIIGLAHCLVADPKACKYAEHFKDTIYCFHPDSREIIARTGLSSRT